MGDIGRREFLIAAVAAPVIVKLDIPMRGTGVLGVNGVPPGLVCGNVHPRWPRGCPDRILDSGHLGSGSTGCDAHRITAKDWNAGTYGTPEVVEATHQWDLREAYLRSLDAPLV